MISPIQPVVARVIVITRSAKCWSDIARWLADEATTVIHAEDPKLLQTEERPDVIVLDRDLLVAPDLALRRIRKRWPTIIIAVMRATDERDVIRLLDAGADDAVTIESPALEARLHSITRRARTVNAGMRIAVGDILFDREAHRVWCAGHEVELTPTEEAFLDCLFWHSPQTVGHTTLTDFVWGEDVTQNRRNMVRVYMGYLRTKLKTSRRVAIRTVRGVGYSFTSR